MNIESTRVMLQKELTNEDYNEAMIRNLLDLDDIKCDALNRLEAQKRKIAKEYNLIVMAKSFRKGELVWKTILPLGTKDPTYGKWSPNWEDSFEVKGVLPNKAYHLKDLNGRVHARAINGKYLKRYMPSLWEHENVMSL